LARFATFKSHLWGPESFRGRKTKPEGLAASGAERWMHTSIVTRAKK
jgi:hypothetical protein